MDGTAAAPIEREEGKAVGSKVADTAARVGCCVLVEMLYSVDVLYGTILLHNYEMLAFPDIKMRGKGHKKIMSVSRHRPNGRILPTLSSVGDMSATCQRHVADIPS